MIPIEQTRDGAVMFLSCGCSGWRLPAHPTGAAVAVVVLPFFFTRILITR